jgi:hypothetical protein
VIALCGIGGDGLDQIQVKVKIIDNDLISQDVVGPFNFGCSFVAFLLQPHILTFPFFTSR